MRQPMISPFILAYGEVVVGVLWGLAPPVRGWVGNAPAVGDHGGVSAIGNFTACRLMLHPTQSGHLATGISEKLCTAVEETTSYLD